MVLILNLWIEIALDVWKFNRAEDIVAIQLLISGDTPTIPFISKLKVSTIIPDQKPKDQVNHVGHLVAADAFVD